MKKMKLLEKFKNMFTEQQDNIDEEDDIIVEKIQNDVTQVPIETPNSKKNNRFDEEEIEEKFKFKDEEKKEIKPIFFDENDFNDLNFKSESKKPEKKLDLFDERVKNEEKFKVEEKVKKDSKENSEPETGEYKKVFKPTPIISPIYGILDKNYHKEDIVSRTETKKEPEVISSIDAVRNKAYGTLEDELENTLFSKNSILFKNNFNDINEEEQKNKNKEVDEDTLSNLTDDIGKELDELLVKKEKNVDEETNNEVKNNNLDEEDLLGFIDSTLYKKGDEEQW